MKRIAFFVDRGLGILLSQWAVKNRARTKNKILILCKEQNKKYFRGGKVKITHSEKEAFAFKPDIVFSINYWSKIPRKLVDMTTIVNLHHSYNLKYRGRHTCSWAIINARKHNDWIHGTTLHIIDEKLDCGKIIYSYPCPIFENDTAYSLFLRVEKLAAKMFKDNFIKILNGKYGAMKLPPSEFFYRESDLTHFIDLRLPLIEIYDHVRALTFPGKPAPYTVLNKHRIDLLWEGALVSDNK